jgi:hypothetical protein
MNVPFVLRWALAWAALTGQYRQVSVDSHRDWGTTYRFDVAPKQVERWLKRRDRINAKRVKEGLK